MADGLAYPVQPLVVAHDPILAHAPDVVARLCRGGEASASHGREVPRETARAPPVRFLVFAPRAKRGSRTTGFEMCACEKCQDLVSR